MVKDEALTILSEVIPRGYISKEHKGKLASNTKLFQELSSKSEGPVPRGCRIVPFASHSQYVTTPVHEGHKGVVNTKEYLGMHM